MVALSEVLQRKTDILRIADEHGARDVRVFGSVVRGESVRSSDLDLLVRMDEDRSLIDRIALKHDLEDLLGCEVDVINERALAPRVRERVSREQVKL